MVELTKLAVALLPLLVLPFCVGSALPGRETRYATRWWFGIMLCGLLIVVGHAIRVPQSVTLGSTIGVAGMCAGFAIVVRWRDGIVTRRALLYCLLLVAVLFLPVAAAVFQTLARPALGGDAVVIWYAKAKALYAWLPLSALPIPEYPHLGSTLWMFVLSWVGPDFESIGRLLFPFTYLFWVLGLVELSYPRYPLAAAILLPVVAVLFLDFEFYTNGYQDGFVMAAAGMSATLMVKTLSDPCSAEPLAAGGLHATLGTSQWKQDCYLASFLAGMLGLVKQEGAVMGAILMTLWIAGLAARGRRTNRGRLLRQVVRVTVLYVLVGATWPLLRLWYGIPQIPYFFTPASVIHALGQSDRFYAIYPYLATYYVQLRPVVWACLVLSVGAIIVVPRVRMALAFLWGVSALHVSFVLLVFMSTRAPLEWHLQTAFARLMSQHVFVYGTIRCVTVFALLASLSAPRLPSARQAGEGGEGAA